MGSCPSNLGTSNFIWERGWGVLVAIWGKRETSILGNQQPQYDKQQAS